MNFSNLPLPDPSDFEFVIDKLIAKVADHRIWDEVRDRHSQTRFAFHFVATASENLGDVFPDEQANLCLAFAYRHYVERAKQGVADIKIMRSRKPSQFQELGDMMVAFNSEQRSKVVSQLFGIGDEVLYGSRTDACLIVQNHLFDFASMLRSSSGESKVEATPTHELWNPNRLDAAVDARLSDVEKKSMQLIDGLDKSPYSRLKLIRQLTSLLWVLKNTYLWLTSVGDAAPKFTSALKNLWLAADIAFHESMYQMRAELLRIPYIREQLSRESIWYMGHNATIAQIMDSINELESVISAIKEGNAIGLVEYSTRHIVNSLERHYR